MRCIENIKLSARTRLFNLITAILLFNQISFCQYWHPPVKAVNPNRIQGLQKALDKSKPDSMRVNILLDLSSAMYCKPRRTNIDIDSSIFFADSAYRLSSYLGYDKGFNNSLLHLVRSHGILAKFDEVRSLVAKATNEISRTDLLLLLSFWHAYHQIGGPEYDEATKYTGQARLLAKKNNLPEKEIMADLFLAWMCPTEITPNKEEKLLAVLEQYKAIGYPFLHYVYYELTQVHSWHGRSDSALYYIQESLKSIEATNDSAAAPDIYLDAAWMNYNADEYETALQFASKALEAYKLQPGLLPFTDFLLIPTKALRRLNRYEEALTFIRNAQKDYPPRNTDEEIIYLDAIANIYRDMKQYQTAEKYYLKMEDIARTINRNDPLLYKEIAQLYIESRQYDKARHYLSKIDEKDRMDLPQGAWRHLEYMRYLADSATGNYLSALKHHNQIIQYDEIQLREAREKEVKKLSIQYETEKKANEIALLQQTARLQETKLDQAQQLRNFTIAGIGMLSVITILLYRQYRLKQKNIKEISTANAVIEQKNKDITEQNETLEQLVEEKEWLLKEVHHRVKNNLHTVICLLESQAAYLKDEALAAIKDSQHRIYAMSVIHQKLYQSDAREIEINPYIQQLIAHMEDSFGISDRIRFSLDIDNITLNVTQAIPVALIINEAVTNSIKYAFPDNRKAEISITLHELQDHVIRMELADNGIGIDPAVLRREESGSIGMELIKGLSKEIHAQLQIRRDNGTKIEVIFEQSILSRSESSTHKDMRVA